MDDEELIERVRAALEYAQRKHPAFCTEITGWSYNYYMAKLSYTRNKNDYWIKRGRAFADDILREEYYEAFEAASDGRWDDAIAEFAQVAAVAIRCMAECHAAQESEATLMQERIRDDK